MDEMKSKEPNDPREVRRSRFLWGAATSAYQIEGASQEDGKGPSIWDVFCAKTGATTRGETGETACDHYHRYREDVELMKRLNLGAYRFSVSWPRVMPAGRGAVNSRGLDFYDRLVDALCAAGIEPFVTLYHWDLPQVLQDELGGWVCRDMAMIFSDYAGVVYDRLGDRVRNWCTINEPWVVVKAGYMDGVHAPGIRDEQAGYWAGHNLLRAHAYAAARYRNHRYGNGQISFALNTSYSYPASGSAADVAAAERAMMNFAGWFAQPVYDGDYPALLRERLGPLLPEFTYEDQQLLRGSMDTIALNYYTSDVVRHATGAGPMETELVSQPDVLRTAMDWPIVPEGLHRLLHWLSDHYPGLPIYITENGAAFGDRAVENGFVDDQDRISYLREHMTAMEQARSEGVDVRGYFVWSLMDNLEWAAGFDKRFGLVRCDFKTQKRTIKASGEWYAGWISRQRAAKRMRNSE